MYVLQLVNVDNSVTRGSQRQRFDVDCECYSVIRRLLTGVALLLIHKVYSRRTQCVSTQRTHCKHDVHFVYTCTHSVYNRIRDVQLTLGVQPYVRCIYVRSVYIRTVTVHCTPFTLYTPVRSVYVHKLGVHKYTMYATIHSVYIMIHPYTMCTSVHYVYIRYIRSGLSVSVHSVDIRYIPDIDLAYTRHTSICMSIVYVACIRCIASILT